MRLTLGAKLFGGFAAILALMVVLGLLAITKMGSIADGARTINEDIVTSVSLVDDIARDTQIVRKDQFRHAAELDAETMREIERDLAKDEKLVAGHFANYEKLVGDDEADRRLFERVQGEWRAYLEGSEPFLAFSRADRSREALEVLSDTTEDFQTLEASIGEWAEANDKTGDATYAAAQGTYEGARVLTIILLLGALLLGAGLAFVIVRAVRRSVSDVLERLTVLQERDATELAAALDAMADGDLTVEVRATTQPIEKVGTDEIGEIATATNSIRDSFVSAIDSYNRMGAQLRGVIGQVSSSATTVSSASQQMASTSEEAGRAVGEIAHAIGEVAQGAERQVRQVESVKQGVDQTTTAAVSSAEQAQEASRAADQAQTIALEGVDAAKEASAAMAAVAGASQEVTGAIGQLASKSEEIGTIVQTIQGIAQQTNLLALNAAIEAARAGEQGRGFAVVAEEVRKLAEESQNAAGTIAGLIEQIQGETQKVVGVVQEGARRSEEGTETVGRTADAFARIGSAVEDVNARIGNIAGAAEQIAADARRMQDEVSEVASVAEQSSASSEEVSASTEQTSASTQQIAASAQELASTAQELERLVGKFRVEAAA